METDRMHDPSAEQLLISVPRAAQMLDISKSKLYELINDGTVPAIRIGKSIRIPLDWLRKWLAEQPKIFNGS